MELIIVQAKNMDIVIDEVALVSAMQDTRESIAHPVEILTTTCEGFAIQKSNV